MAAEGAILNKSAGLCGVNRSAAVATVFVAPLVGAVVWLTPVFIGMQQTGFNVWSDFGGWLVFLGFAYVYALILTICVGLPVGFVSSLLIRGARLEKPATYPLVGAIGGLLVGLPLGSFREFVPSSAAVGLILGLGYWRYLRRPVSPSARGEGLGEINA